ncbi:restriction endonuclease subunit S [Peptacetobacter hiranonis]|uniref:restriction endonuclease subunit S n=1 Tax=Peptacetobacter hiranonis TaxID=89152 RepID=UPI003D816488
MGNNDKRPKIRFKGFNDDWEQHKVSEITNFHKQGFYTTESYNDEKKYYLLRGTDLTENKLILKDTPKINATEKDYQAFKAQIGDFLIVRSGTVGTYGIVYEDIPAIFGSYLIDFRFNKNQVINEFFGYFYQSDLFKNQLKMIIQQSANTNINAENIKSTFIKLPSLAEQKKISDYFQNIDHLISLHQRKLEKLGNIKKSMLEKMFPKDENKVPEIRFKGFNDDWEQRKLIEYLAVSKVKNKDEAYNKDDVLSVSGDYGIVNQIEFQGRSFAGASVTNYGVVATGDVVYTKSPLKSNPYGIIKTNKGKTGIVSTLYAVYKPLENTYPEFVQIYFEQDARMNNYMHPLVNKGAKNDMKVSDENALKGDVIFPQKEEQIKISEYFLRLDNLISLHQRKLEKLKNIKKACLEKMFV